MKKVQIEFDELPFSTLERFGLTREMIEDLPMRVLEDICLSLIHISEPTRPY